MMCVIASEREQIRTAAERWKARFHPSWFETQGSGAMAAQAIYHRLCALPPEATAAEVTAIIGDETWRIDEICTECALRQAVVLIGREPDDATVRLCPVCLNALVALRDTIDASTPEPAKER